jgi:hypothetical protein
MPPMRRVRRVPDPSLPPNARFEPLIDVSGKFGVRRLRVIISGSFAASEVRCLHDNGLVFLLPISPSCDN